MPKLTNEQIKHEFEKIDHHASKGKYDRYIVPEFTECIPDMRCGVCPRIDHAYEHTMNFTQASRIVYGR